MLGDLNIAEPKALIGFAGPRVIEQTIRQKLPEGFQRSEFLVDHGMLDIVVDRRDLKSTMAQALPSCGPGGPQLRCSSRCRCSPPRRPDSKGQLTSQLLDRLFALETFGIKLGLDNITTLCEALGHPERSFTSLHVAGTNGKGSVTAMAHAALRAAGGTRLAPSPHLSDLSERFVVAIARSTARRSKRSWTTCWRARTGCGPRARCRYADVLRGHHCGSVRAVSSRRDRDRRDRGRAGWTLRRDQRHLARGRRHHHVDFDHQQHLGYTLQAIAFEKAGIIKPGMTIVLGALPRDAHVITRVADERERRSWTAQRTPAAPCR